jgi:hypothetical protein
MSSKEKQLAPLEKTFSEALTDAGFEPVDIGDEARKELHRQLERSKRPTNPLHIWQPGDKM